MNWWSKIFNSVISNPTSDNKTNSSSFSNNLVNSNNVSNG